MSDSRILQTPGPWVWIIGIGEDGLPGLSESSRDALAKAEIVFGGVRHLALANVGARGRPWPVPFSVDPVLDCRGRRVAVLASGNPFWFGAGGSLAAHLSPHEWIAYPAPSTFSLAAARMGWRLEDVICLGLHAAPFETLRPYLAPKRKTICLLRDGAVAGALAAWLTENGFGASSLHVLEAIGGPDERIRVTRAENFGFADVAAPTAVAIVAAGGAGLPRIAGLPDSAFVHDGQITKRPVRALTLSALAPRWGEILWDIGAGSGSISVEWCLAGGHAFAIEARADRAANIRANAVAFGVADRLTVVAQQALEAFAGLPPPDAVFIGGGANPSLFEVLWETIPRGARLVANAVTLETEALLLQEQHRRGGDLMRIELSQATPLGHMQSWTSARPVVQWSVMK